MILFFISTGVYIVPLAINTRTLHYTAADGTRLHSYLALPADTNQQVAAVLITPEWWGLTDYPMRRADALAELGYAALAIDVYGEGKTTTDAKQAYEWMMQMLSNVCVSLPSFR